MFSSFGPQMSESYEPPAMHDDFEEEERKDQNPIEEYKHILLGREDEENKSGCSSQLKRLGAIEEESEDEYN